MTSSLYYWAAVIGLTLTFGAIVVETFRRREADRLYRPALAVYLAVFTVVCGLSYVIYPRGPLWAGFPTPLIVGGLVVFIGGHLIAGVFRLIRNAPHRHEPKPAAVALEHQPTDGVVFRDKALRDRLSAAALPIGTSRSRFTRPNYS